MIMKLRKEFDIPEEFSQEEVEQDFKERAARRKRMEIAGTQENYVKLFNRDPWTDQWIGTGPEPEPPMPFLEDEMSPKAAAKAVEKRLLAEREEFKRKFNLDKELPKAKIEPSKETKKIRKAREKRKKEKFTQNQYQRAYWYLHEYLKPEFKDQYYDMFLGDVDGLVKFANDQVDGLEFLAEQARLQKKYKHMSQEDLIQEYFAEKEAVEKGIVVEDGIRWEPVDVSYENRKEVEINYDGLVEIPDVHWDAFVKWSDKHPLKEFKKKARKHGWSTIKERRIKFLKKLNKKNKSFQKQMVLRDPITGMAFVSEKKMKKYNERAIERFAKQRKQYSKYVRKMVDKGYISEDYMETMLGDDKEVIDRIKARYKRVEDRAKKEAKKHEKELEHKKKRDKERIDWFKKFGYDVVDSDKPFEIMADGEKLVLRPRHSGKQRLWELQQDGSSIYAEHIEDFME